MKNIEHELYDIYPTWHIPFWQTSWFYYTIILSGTVFAIALITWFILHRKRQHQPEEPWQKAVAQLAALQEQRYATKQTSKQCYFAITAILKEYLHAQHHIPAIGKTDEELIRFLQKEKYLDRPIIDQLATICNGCIYIKFANQSAVQQQIREHLALSIQIVEQTKPRPATS